MNRSCLDWLVPCHAGVNVTLESGETLRAPVVIGADGVRSRIAKALGLADANFAGYIAYRWTWDMLQRLLIFAMHHSAAYNYDHY